MRTFLLALAASALCAASLRAQPISDEERKEGFVPLFNGKDFSGLRFSGKNDVAPKNWSVADGMIKLSGGGSPHLGTQWPYGDFDVRMRWKAHKKGYNSGFYVRSGRNVGANQINLAQNDCGHLMGGAKGGNKVPELQKEPGEWNDWRVLAVGDKLTFWCNGKQAWEVTGFKPASGHIGWQAEGAAIDFKDLRIREIGFQRLLADGEGAIEKAGTLPLAAKAEKDFALRIEYRAKDGTTLALKGTAGAVDLKGVLAKNAAAGEEWNYLEIAVRKGAVEVWQNGDTVHKGGTPPTGDLVLEASGPVSIRNARFQASP